MPDTQRTTEWLSDEIDFAYHAKQFDEPYESTKAFARWLAEIGAIEADPSASVLDIGCGQGANAYYMSQVFTNADFLGVDLNESLVTKGNALLRERSADRVHLARGDIYNLGEDLRGKFGCITCIQMLSWLDDFRTALRCLAQLRSRWICATSLFYEGPVSCTIDVTAHLPNGDQRSYYNVYSIEKVKEYFNELGYLNFHYIPFLIEIDLPRPPRGELGTYTERLEDGRRLQFSGPLSMPWYFVAAERD